MVDALPHVQPPQIRRRTHFGLRSLFLVVTFFCAISSGAAWLWFRPDPPNPHHVRLREVEQRLGQFSPSLGAWKATGNGELKIYHERYTDAVLTFSHRYKHAQTGEQFEVFLMAARPKEAAYRQFLYGYNLEYESDPTGVSIENPPKHATFVASVTNANPQRGISYWTTTSRGNWTVPASMRNVFSGDKLVYKLFLTAERPTNVDPLRGISETKGPATDLAEVVLPELDRLLFRSPEE